MPTIEIVSIDSKGLNLNPEDFDVAIIEEKVLRSHRGLFYDFLNKQNGVIIHIGNPEFKDSEIGGFFAGEIIDWEIENSEISIPENETDTQFEDRGANQQFKFKFRSEYKSDIDKLLRKALENSPIKKVYFLTDYQFGPENSKKEIIYTIKDLWKLHDNEGLLFNKLYELYGQ